MLIFKKNCIWVIGQKNSQHKHLIHHICVCFFSVDATAESGKLGRLLNHSKAKANCMTKTVGIYDKPHLILVAKRDIKIGEELLYDYGDRSKSSLEAHPWLAYWAV